MSTWAASDSTVFGRFEIVLDAGEQPVFHGGELITGNLKILLKRPMTIQAIKLQFKGRAAYATNEASKGGAEVEKVYFDRDFTLLERPPGRPEPGHFPWISNFLYSLPFECPLPIGCPTSYEGPYAFIRYYARATVVEESGTDTVEYMVKKPLSVVAPVDSPAVESSVHPVGASETASFGGCCCRGKITADVQLPKSAYLPGEAVIGTLKIDNKHPRHVVDHVEVRLVDRVTRVGTSGTASGHRTVLHRKLDQTDVVKSKASLHRDDVLFLHIPPVAPSTPGPAAPLISDVYSMSPNENAPSSVASKLLESPSTATLRFRKQPFLRLDYAIQISLGTQLLLEVPITVKALPIRGEAIVYEGFACGPQAIDETDETAKKKLGAGFTFTPQYPVLRGTANAPAAPSPPQAAPNATLHVNGAANVAENGAAPVTA